MRPTITEHDAITGETIGREMTEEEYSALLSTGWIPDEEPAPVEEPVTEEPPALEEEAEEA